MAKTKNKKRILPLFVITAAVVTAAVVFVSIRKAAVSVDVYPASMLLESSWENNTLSGEVTEGRIQNVPLKEGIVDEICVSEGQSVSAHDKIRRGKDSIS